MKLNIKVIERIMKQNRVNEKDNDDKVQRKEGGCFL